ncbi:MAG: TIGR00153 family protein [Gammaproteobacteria bacterium]|nr:TIGR00153 family protein [Gammaproteobacteria bacterium]
MSNAIGALFGRSPIRPVQEHMAKAQNCVALLGEILEAGFNNEWQKAEELFQAISTAENAADKLERDIRIHLPKSLFLPVARSDLIDLVRYQDRMSNRAKEIAGLVVGRKMQTPENLVGLMREHYQNALNTSTQALKAINELDELLVAGFGGREAVFVEGLVVELDRLKNKSESSQSELRSCLFDMEDSLQPIEAVFLYKVIDKIEEIAGIAYKLGGSLLLLVAR